MGKIKAFILGVIEFKQTFTTYIADYALMVAYDAGRELAHRLTFRRYEQ